MSIALSAASRVSSCISSVPVDQTFTPAKCAGAAACQMEDLESRMLLSGTKPIICEPPIFPRPTGERASFRYKETDGEMGFVTNVFERVKQRVNGYVVERARQSDGPPGLGGYTAYIPGKGMVQVGSDSWDPFDPSQHDLHLYKPPCPVYADWHGTYDGQPQSQHVQNLGVETVTVPFGTFRTVKLKVLRYEGSRLDEEFSEIVWLDPSFGEIKGQSLDGTEVYELFDYRPVKGSRYVDLTGAFGKVSLPATVNAETQAKVRVSFNVVNRGTMAVPAKRKMAISIVLRPSGAAGSDVLIARLPDARLGSLAPSQRKTLNFNLTLPSHLAPGDYRLTVLVDSAYGIAESNEANNTVLYSRIMTVKSAT